MSIRSIFALILCVAIVFCLCCPSLCESDEGGEQTVSPVTEFSLDSMTIEELLDLRDRVEGALLARGYCVYYDIERNDKGENVVRLQERLTELGYYTGKITGKLDNETMKAQKQFEKNNGLMNDGLPSRMDQITLFSDTAVGKQSPVVTPAPTTKAEDEKYSGYGTLDYEDAFRYPENHRGEKVSIKCRVVQVLGDRKSGFQLRVSILGTDDIVYVFIYSDPGYNILENDSLTVYGKMIGTITYESIFGQSITIPACQADHIVLR